MEQQTVRKTYKERLRPTPAQERALEEVLGRCRSLDNMALEERITFTGIVAFRSHASSRKRN
jgi:hypothetical protein